MGLMTQYLPPKRLYWAMRLFSLGTPMPPSPISTNNPITKVIPNHVGNGAGSSFLGRKKNLHSQ